MPNWIVIRTRPRWEKKVAQLLGEKGIETFCPLVKKRRQWSDRMKTVEMPLLPSILFVRISEEQRTCVRVTEGVMNFVYRNGKPVMVKEKLIQQIRLFQQTHTEVVAMASSDPGGILDGMITAPAKNKAFTLGIEPLGIVLMAGLLKPIIIEASTDKN